MENKNKKILIVDDEPEVVSTLTHFLNVKGYDTLGAFNGKEALDIIHTQKIDLILLDIRLPDIKGDEIAKVVKDDYPHIKIIVVSGYADEADILAKDVHLDGMFIKPVAIHDLYNKLLQVIEPKEIGALDLKEIRGIKARLFLIKAKVLFIEPSTGVFNLLKSHFNNLINKGEIYEVNNAVTGKDINKTTGYFKPDIIAVNMLFFKKYSSILAAKIIEQNSFAKEIIVYNIAENSKSINTELERLSRTTQLSCLKNGLVEIKWVEI